MSHLPNLSYGNEVRRQRAIARAQELQPIIDRMRQSGITSWYGLANALNKEGILPTRGGLWRGGQLRMVMQRLEADSDANAR